MVAEGVDVVGVITVFSIALFGVMGILKFKIIK